MERVLPCEPSLLAGPAKVLEASICLSEYAHTTRWSLPLVLHPTPPPVYDNRWHIAPGLHSSARLPPMPTSSGGVLPRAMGPVPTGAWQNKSFLRSQPILPH